MQRLTTFMLSLCVCTLASSASAAIAITSGETYAEVNDGQGSSNYADLFNSSGTIATASIPGHYSQTTTNFSSAGNSASFSGAFNQLRQGNYGSYAYGAFVVYFSPDTNLPYTASGAFSNTDGFTYLYSYLYDYTTNTYPFISDQESQGAPAAFALGGSAGNFYNSFVGSLTGTLTAGDARYIGNVWMLLDLAATKVVPSTSGPRTNWVSPARC